MKRFCDMLGWSVSLRNQLVHRYDVSNWSVLFTYQWDVAKTSQIGPSYWHMSGGIVMMSQHGPGRSNLSIKWVNLFLIIDSTFCGISGGSVSLRYQLVRRYNVSKTSVAVRYWLSALCDVSSWSVLLKYQLVCRYSVSNWMVFSTYQWDVSKTSQIDPSHSGTSCDVMMTPQYVLGHLDLYET